MDILIKGVSFGLVLAVMVGPVFFTLIQTSLEKGYWSGVFVALGISLSDVFYICVAYFGVAQLAKDPAFQANLAHVGGIIFVVFGVFSLFKKTKKTVANPQKGTGNYLKCVLKGFLVNGLSPFVLIFWVGAVSIASVEYHFSDNGLLIFFAITVGTVFLTDVSKAYLADKLRTLITPRFLRIMNIVVGIVLIAFGSRLFFYEF